MFLRAEVVEAPKMSMSRSGANNISARALPSFISSYSWFSNALIWLRSFNLLAILNPISCVGLSCRVNSMRIKSRNALLLSVGERKCTTLQFWIALWIQMVCPIDSLRHVRNTFRHCESNCDQRSARNVVYVVRTPFTRIVWPLCHRQSTAKGQLYPWRTAIFAPLNAHINTPRTHVIHLASFFLFNIILHVRETI
jgi:hypothetical protein